MEEKKIGRLAFAARGLAIVFVGLLVVMIGAYMIVDSLRSTIDMYMGTKSFEIVTEEVAEGEDLYNFRPKEECSTTQKLVEYHKDVTRRIAREGTVLLKNDNAMPLDTEEEKNVTLLGNCSYRPWKGGLLGSRAASGGGDGVGNGDAVDIVKALTEKSFSINPTVKSRYDTYVKTNPAILAIDGMLKSMGGSYSSYLDGTFPEILDLYAEVFAGALNGGSGITTVSPKYENNAMYGLAALEMNAATMAGDAEVDSANDEYGTAIVTIGRPGSEAMSYTPGAGGRVASIYTNGNDALGLSDTEIATLDYAKKNYDKVIVLLNTAVAMDLPELDGYADAILWVGMPNDYGFRGVADVLDGTVSPSGHLVDTYAARASVSPAMQNYGVQMFTDAGDPADAETFAAKNYANFSYQAEMESIYVGYKYYESRYYDSVFGKRHASAATAKQTAKGSSVWNYDDEVVYSFGEGYSYTDFSETLVSSSFDPIVKDGMLDGKVELTVNVKNTGNVKGKHVVQLYMQAPYLENGVEKSAIQLVGYGKTSELEPNGGNENVTISVDADYVTSYDMTAGHYILDAGTYYFATGNGAHDALNNIIHEQDASKGIDGSYGVVFTKNLPDKLNVTKSESGEEYGNKLKMSLEENGITGKKYLSRKDWNGTFPDEVVIARTKEMMDAGLDNKVYEVKKNDDVSHIKWGVGNNLKYTDLKPKKDEMIAFDDKRFDFLLEQIKLEEAVKVFLNSRTSILAIDSIGQPIAYEADGPTGINEYKLGTQSRKGDYFVKADDPNASFFMATLPTAAVIASTFSHELAQEAGEVVGNDSIWCGVPMLWGPCGNIHRTPYNARNIEYFSEDGVLTGFMASDYGKGALKYGCVVMNKHFAFNDVEFNRQGIAPFMTEQAARENELRGFQIGVELGNVLGLMTAYNRAGACYASANVGLMQGVLRGEWGFNGVVISDLAGDQEYMNARDALAAGTDIMLAEGDKCTNSKGWTDVSAKNLAKDAHMQTMLKDAMHHIEYVLLNSNFMNGVNGSSHTVRLYTWYDMLCITGISVCAVFTVLFAALSVILTLGRRKEKV